MATQILLEAVKGRTLKKVVYASSSSVYGQAEKYPTSETALPLPMSPYGTTKLAGERLCYAYHKNYGIPVICLRYFTVYGPRQRPDMAFARFIKSMTLKETMTVFGDGTQTRDFTYVTDIVRATILASESDHPWEILNVGGGSRTTLTNVIQLLQRLVGNVPQIIFSSVQKGDVHDTCADVSKAREVLGYVPSVGIEEGLASEVKYFQARTS
jgi:UDP-glucose 4-epimerase